MIKEERLKKTDILGDYYWDYADIMRGLGIKEGIYDERILGFMTLKLLVDNNKVPFNFNFSNEIIFQQINEKLNQVKPENKLKQENPFNCKIEHVIFNKNKEGINVSINYSETFKNILKNIKDYDCTLYFYKRNDIKKEEEWKLWNLNKYNVNSELEIINNKNVFTFDKYIDELLGDDKFLAVLDIYERKANFVEKYYQTRKKII